MTSKNKLKRASLISVSPEKDVTESPHLLSLFTRYKDLLDTIVSAKGIQQRILREIRDRFGRGPFRLGPDEVVIIDNKGTTYFLSDYKEASNGT